MIHSIGADHKRARQASRFDDEPAPLVTRRHLQVLLGLLWLLDGALQLQPYMFTRGFSAAVIAPTASGQPGWVAAGVAWSAHLIDMHPVLLDALFAGVQLALGLGMLLRRTAAWALVASVPWALGVWYLGEGLGGIASGQGNLLTGTPGAVILYALVALAAWPSGPLRSSLPTWMPGSLPASLRGRARSPEAAQGSSTEGGEALATARPRPAVGWAWAAVWISGASLSIAGGGFSGHSLSSTFRAAAMSGPSLLAGSERRLATMSAAAHGGIGIALVLLEILVGLTAFAGTRVRFVGASVGVLLALAFWVFGESIGLVYSGRATDPNSGPLLVLLAIALVGLGSRPLWRGAHGASRHEAPVRLESRTSVTNAA